MNHLEYHPVLMCGLCAVTVGPNWVVMFLPDSNCTDMDGAIKVGLAVNPDAVRIITVSGKRNDTVYLNEGDGWKALVAKEPRP